MNFFFRSVQGFAFQGHLLGSHKAYFVKHPITDFFLWLKSKVCFKVFFLQNQSFKWCCQNAETILGGGPDHPPK